MRLVIDTNRIIAALVKDSLCRYLITHMPVELVSIQFSAGEIEKHKKVLIQKSNLSEAEFDLLADRLFAKMTILGDTIVNLHVSQAAKIMDKIDRDDTPFIAAALATKADIWSDDAHFDKQKRVKIWKTKDLVKRFYNL